MWAAISCLLHICLACLIYPHVCLDVCRCYDRAAYHFKGDRAVLNHLDYDYARDPFILVCLKCIMQAAPQRLGTDAPAAGGQGLYCATAGTGN